MPYRSLFAVLALAVALPAQEPIAPAESKSDSNQPPEIIKPLQTPAPAETITIPAGTKVPLVLKSAISTKSARVGDGVYMETAFPVTQNNQMVIPAGTYVQGVITHVKRPGRVHGNAELQIHFTTLIYPSGYTISMPGAVQSASGSENAHVKDEEGTIQGDSQKGKDAATVATTAATGTLIGGLSNGAKGAGIGAGAGAAVGLAIALLTRGNDVRLEVGSSVEMVFERPVVLDASKINGPIPTVAKQTSSGKQKLTPPPDLR